MIVMQTIIDVKGLKGKEVTDFMLNCNDENYQKWWEGTHFQFHIIKEYPDHIGDIVYMDEFIGEHRTKMKAVVVKAIPGQLIIWQLKNVVKLPITVTLKLKDTDDGVIISHTLKAGFKGIGKIFDFIFRQFFPPGFEKAMDEHAKIEFPKLRDLLHKTSK